MGARCLPLFLIALCTLVSAPIPSGAQPPARLTAAVVKVLGGDSIEARVGDRLESVRYLGVRAAESSLGRTAAEVNRRLVDGQTVELELDVEERDRTGRLLAYVYLGDIMVRALGWRWKRATPTADQAWSCPATHPIKGTPRTAVGERCVYLLPGDALYERIKARRCYASEAEASDDGCRRSR